MFYSPFCVTSICISRFAFTKDLHQTQKFVLTPTCTRSPTFRSTKSYPPVFSVPFAQRPRPRVGARCLQGNSAFDVIQLGTIEPERAPPKSRTSSTINILMIAVVILSVRLSPSAVMLSNNGCRGTKIGIEFGQHVLMFSFTVQ